VKHFGWLRVSKGVEIVGIDIAEMGGVSAALMRKILKDQY
jgi:p-aminobenzoyl-glutamate transporter AbgT